MVSNNLGHIDSAEKLQELRSPKFNFHQSFRFAAHGFMSALKSQRNMKIHVLCGLGVCLFMMHCPLVLAERIMLFLCIALVLAAELLNTAIEACVDLCSPHFHHLAKKAKDTAAAAVLVLSITAALVFLYIAGPTLKGFLATPTAVSAAALSILAIEHVGLFYGQHRCWGWRWILSGTLLLFLAQNTQDIAALIFAAAFLALSSLSSNWSDEAKAF